MSSVLKLRSSETGVGRICLFPENIESFFEFDEEKSISKIEMLIEALNGEIVDWGESALKFLKKSKSVEAKKLAEDFEKLYFSYMDELEDQDEELKKYRVIRLYTGTLYSVKETIDEIEDMLSDITTKEKLGF